MPLDNIELDVVLMDANFGNHELDKQTHGDTCDAHGAAL